MLKLKKKKISFTGQSNHRSNDHESRKFTYWYILKTFYKTPVLKGPVTILV